MSQYTTGTITTTAGSATITGSGTAWLANVSVGDEIFVGDDGIRGEISGIASDTSITLVAPFPETLYDETYAIVSDFTYNRSYPLLNTGDAHSADILRRVVQMIDADMQFQLTFGGSVLDILDAAPTSGVSVGDRYLVADPVAGGDEWTGYENYLATYTGTSGDEWDYEAPVDGEFVINQDDSTLYLYVGDDDEWVSFALSVNSCDGDFTINDGDLLVKISSTTRVKLDGAGDSYLNPTTGGFGIYTATPAAPLHVVGATLLDGAVTINDSSADVDFRVESNGNAKMLFVDGGNDRVGIGLGAVAAPDTTAHIMASDASAASNADAVLTLEKNGNAGLQILTPDANTGKLMFGDTAGSDVGTLQYNHAVNYFNFYVGGRDVLDVGYAQIIFNDASNDVDFRVESNGNANALNIDGGTDKVGVMQAAGDNTLELTGTFGIGTGSATTGKINIEHTADGETLNVTRTGGTYNHKIIRRIAIKEALKGTDGTFTLWSMTMGGASPLLQVAHVRATVTMRAPTATTASASWVFEALCHGSGAAATVSSAGKTASAGNDAEGADANIDASGNDVRLRIDGCTGGENGTNTDWTANIEITLVG